MNDLPTITSYVDYSSDNYGAHALRVDVGNLTLWYSYKTVIAFRAPGTGRVVSENAWSTTTGKHLNQIDGGDKKNRLPRAEFEDKLRQAIAKYQES